jgi:hypothetical protein
MEILVVVGRSLPIGLLSNNAFEADCGRTVLATDCVLAGAEAHRAWPLN